MGRSKVVYGDEVLIDLTADTVDAEHLLKGKTAHNSAGEVINGTCEFDADTTDATAKAGEILLGQTAYVNGNKLTGEMPNRGAVEGKISTKNGEYVIQNGFHDGSGKVTIEDTEKAKILPGNIKAGVEILGVEGTYGGEDIKAQKKTATPYTTAQSILPDAGFDYLSQVDIEPIAYVETPNAAGGTTVTIGTVKPS